MWRIREKDKSFKIGDSKRPTVEETAIVLVKNFRHTNNIKSVYKAVWNLKKYPKKSDSLDFNIEKKLSPFLETKSPTGQHCLKSFAYKTSPKERSRYIMKTILKFIPPAT